MLDYIIEIGITSTKFPRNPISASLGDGLAIRNHLKLASLTWPHNWLYIEFFFDERHETRDLGLVIFSRGAVNDFDFHCVYYGLMIWTSAPGTRYDNR